MSEEHTKGEIEYSVVAVNAIDIVSKENEAEVVAGIVSESDELGTAEIANAYRLVKCWNCHDELVAALEDLFNDCRNVPMDDQRNKVMEQARAALTKAEI